jgi:membrane dipeptidase
VLSQTPVVDGHNDLVAQFIAGDSLLNPNRVPFDSTSGQTDLKRWIAGGVGGSFVTIAGSYKSDVAAGVDETLNLLHQLIAKYPDRLTLGRSSSDILRSHANGRVAIFPHLEGAEQLGGSLDRLHELHARGLASLGLTWNRTNDLADAALDKPRWQGLSPLGKRVVQKSNDLGILLDLSHASDSATLAAIEFSRAPVMLSHSSLRSRADDPRNAPDHVLTALGKRGGIIMVTFVPYFTTTEYAAWYARGELVWDSLKTLHSAVPARARAAMEVWERHNPAPRVTVADVADHIEHARSVVGIDHVGIGSDFDGMYSRVFGLESVAEFPNILTELALRGWTESDLRKLAGGNIMRVLDSVRALARP